MIFFSYFKISMFLVKNIPSVEYRGRATPWIGLGKTVLYMREAINMHSI